MNEEEGKKRERRDGKKGERNEGRYKEVENGGRREGWKEQGGRDRRGKAGR